MQAVEGLTRLIAIADQTYKDLGDPQDEAERKEFENDQVAISIAQAMLNTALPVARFRVFVRIESGRETGREFTICAVNIEDIVAALYPLSTMVRQVYISLWEQRQTGADMLEGFQGWTHSPGQKKALRLFLDGLKKYSSMGLAN